MWVLIYPGLAQVSSSLIEQIEKSMPWLRSNILSELLLITSASLKELTSFRTSVTYKHNKALKLSALVSHKSEK